MTEEKLKSILIAHYQRYPNMQVLDMIKLIYQQTFGPAHFSSSPSLKSIKEYLINELHSVKFNQETPLIEDIGNDYYRISLKMIVDQLLSLEDLSVMFYQSMSNSPSLSDHTKQEFLKKIDSMIMLNQKKVFNYDNQDLINEVKSYIQKGIHATHHSEEYLKHYDPHYRVIHKKYIAKNMIDVYTIKSE